MIAQQIFLSCPAVESTALGCAMLTTRACPSLNLLSDMAGQHAVKVGSTVGGQQHMGETPTRCSAVHSNAHRPAGMGREGCHASQRTPAPLHSQPWLPRSRRWSAAAAAKQLLSTLLGRLHEACGVACGVCAAPLCAAAPIGQNVVCSASSSRAGPQHAAATWEQRSSCSKSVSTGSGCHAA